MHFVSCTMAGGLILLTSFLAFLSDHLLTPVESVQAVTLIRTRKLDFFSALCRHLSVSNTLARRTEPGNLKVARGGLDKMHRAHRTIVLGRRLLGVVCSPIACTSLWSQKDMHCMSSWRRIPATLIVEQPTTPCHVPVERSLLNPVSRTTWRR